MRASPHLAARLLVGDAMRSLFLACLLSCVTVASASRAALAEDADVGDPAGRSFAERGVYPVLLVASMALTPDGMEGRWGLGVERHPSRPTDGASWSGVGFGFGAEAGFLSGGDVAASSPSTAGGWFSPVLRPGFFWASRKETSITGGVSIGLAPVVDVLETGDAHLTLSAQPGFQMAVEHFAFALAMRLDGRVVSTDSDTGLGVGVKFGLGGSI